MQAQPIIELITKLSAPLIEEMDLELVDVELVRERGQLILRVLIDKESGVSLSHCEKLNRWLSDELDRLDPIPQSYNLEVSSAGLERPLKRPAEFDRFSGKLASIRLYTPLDGRKKFTGILRGVACDQIQLEVDHAVLSIPIDQISKANLVYTPKSI